jgi:hypothetical protein
LQFIDLSYCKHISSEALGTFVSSCKELKYFSSKGLKNVCFEKKFIKEKVPSLIGITILDE